MKYDVSCEMWPQSEIGQFFLKSRRKLSFGKKYMQKSQNQFF